MKTTAAQTAKAIRIELKSTFPNVKFSVTSDSFAGGNAVRIEWTDGATTDQVEQVTNKYQYGEVDGMTDSYNYTNTRNDIPQVKYVQTTRNYSTETWNAALLSVDARCQQTGERVEVMARRELWNKSF